MDVLDLLATENYIIYNKQLARQIGIESAILLGALSSYQRYYGDEEFFKEQEKLIEDTCLSEYLIRNATKNLCKLDLIRVIKKGLPAKNYYKINKDKLFELLTTSSIKFDTTGGVKNDTTCCDKFNTTYNNKEIIIKNNNKEDNIYISPSEQKHRYGEYNHVLLTDKQYNKLAEDYGESKTLEAIKYLDEYIQMKGYKCKDHNLAMRKWVFDAISKNKKDRTMDILNELYEEAGRETENEGRDFIWNYQSKM